jgi:hypothetical protein
MVPAFAIVRPWLFSLYALVCWGAVHGFGWLPTEGEAWAFTLTTPTQGAALQSGKPVPVSVVVGKEVDVRTVYYHWYRLDEEPLASHRATPAHFVATDPGSSIAGTVLVPAEALGTMRLLVVGAVARGRLEGYEEFDEVLVTVGTTAELSTIEFAVEKPWRLDQVGKRIVVPAVGQFNDGISRPLTGLNVGSTFQSSDDRVVSVDAAGMLQVMGPGKAQVTVENRGKTGTVDVVVREQEGANRAPIAEVAKELHARSGDLVVLDGLRSHDPDGDPLRYEWKQIRGHRVGLSNVSESKATFVAPRVSARKQYQFSLTVTDMAGPDTVKGADSAPAVITVWISP